MFKDLNFKKKDSLSLNCNITGVMLNFVNSLFS